MPLFGPDMGVALAASNTTWGSATVVLSGSANITVSTNGSTVLLSVANPAPAAVVSSSMYNSAALYSLSSSAHINASNTIIRLELPNAVSFTRVGILHSVAMASAGNTNTAACAISSVMVIYSRTGSTLNPIIGASGTTTYSWASNTGVVSSLSGLRVLTMPLASTLSAGEWFIGWRLSTATSSVGAATTNLSMTLAPSFGTRYSAAPILVMSSLNPATWNWAFPMMGIISVILTETSMTRQASQITQTGTAGARANNIVLFQA